jgi:hypothetical protein
MRQPTDSEARSSLSASLSADSVVVVSRDQVSSDLAGEAVILGLTRGVYYGLDPVGSRIWELIQEPRQVRDVRDIIMQEYDVDPEVAERDLLALLEHLQSEGLVEVRSRSA